MYMLGIHFVSSSALGRAHGEQVCNALGIMRHKCPVPNPFERSSMDLDVNHAVQMRGVVLTLLLL